MRDQTAAVALRFAPGTPTSGWRERVHDKVLTVGEAAFPSWWQSDPGTPPPPRPVDVSLTLDSFEIALVEAPTGIHLGASAE